MATGTHTRDWADIDYYEVLGVDVDATEDEIARAFRTLAKQLHPDAGAAPIDVERFKDVATAYEVLGDARIRRDYDHVRRAVVVRPAVPATRAVGRAPTGFAARPVKLRRSFTRRRAWIAVVVGLLTTIAGVTVGILTSSVHNRDEQQRAATIAVPASRVDVDGTTYLSFVTEDGRRVQVSEPDFGEHAQQDVVRYYRDDPERVIAEEDNAGRDITLAIVALKLLVSGPVLAGVGIRRLLRA